MAIYRQFAFETIVVAMDFSDESFSALRYAQAIAVWHRAKLVLVHAVSYPVSVKGLPAARVELARIEEQLRGQKISVCSSIETGNAVEVILRLAREQEADLLVLGRRTDTASKQAVLGHVSRELLGVAECPVLMVASSESFTPWAGRWREVLLATDFSSCSLAALTIAQRIANTRLTVLYSSRGESEEERLKRLEWLRYLAPVDESHTLPVEHVVTSGHAGQVIVDFATRRRVDLVILGCASTMSANRESRAETVQHVIVKMLCPILCVSALPPEKAAAAPDKRPIFLDGRRRPEAGPMKAAS